MDPGMSERCTLVRAFVEFELLPDLLARTLVSEDDSERLEMEVRDHVVPYALDEDQVVGRWADFLAETGVNVDHVEEDDVPADERLGEFLAADAWRLAKRLGLVSAQGLTRAGVWVAAVADHRAVADAVADRVRVLLCGVADDGRIQGMSRDQMAALDRLLVEVCTDAIEPSLRIDVHHRELDGRAFLLVDVPRGDAVHERHGRAFIRVGASKRRLDADERLRLGQRRAQSRYLWFDQQIVPQTGFETLSERLWEPLLSVAGAADPRRGLMNLNLLAQDDAGVARATVAGVLLCAQAPQDWLPQATITATQYRGDDRASGQLDAQEITGPLPAQIAEAVRFVVRNMRVSARKVPERENAPQYSVAAVFEAVVNAVAHRDYSISSRRVRMSMFSDRLEIESPGRLPNGMTLAGMEASQATRNEVIASVFGRVPVGDVPGADHRLYLMERRGDGVSIILKETQETAGAVPEYSVVDESSLVLTVPAAKLELSPAPATVTVHSDGAPLPGVDVLALFPNKTWQRATTDHAGEAALDLYTTHLPMTVYAAARGYSAGFHQEWRPDKGGLLLEVSGLPDGGGVGFSAGYWASPRPARPSESDTRYV